MSATGVRVAPALMLGASLAAPWLLGCPAGVCLVKTNINGRWTCPVSTCAEGSDYDVERNQCACIAGFFSVQGQCLTQAKADQFCGKGNAWVQTGCVGKTCAAGQKLDEGSGECKDAAALASAVGVALKEGETLGCPEGQRLVSEGNVAACVPISETCAPDERFDGTRCVKTKACATGSAVDPSSGECVVFGTSSSSSYLVDTKAWADANYGKDGAPGTSGFCGGFARRPWAFGIQEGQSATVRVSLRIAFAEGSIGAGIVQASPSYVHDPKLAVPQTGVDAVAVTARDILDRLKTGGGAAKPDHLEFSVTCAVVNAAKPAAVPAVGGV